MSDKIHVQPAPDRRRDFARWATGHRPKLRTVGPDTFAVPPRLFVDLPEKLLVGAIVDGHRYRSPVEDEATGTPPPGQVEERVGVPGEPLPPLPASAYPAGAVTLPPVPPAEPTPPAQAVAEVEVEPAPEERDDREDDDQADEDGFPCGVCPRVFGTERGRDTHRRQAHKEG
ncbi:hypothetical protein HTV80_00070 [Streptomyces sp. Vc74B-19]|uniref:hypothetical protein n=1 Tax=Streptomyces sp. Vc74B-19 TaxID=2741324 RepID=UPI001BFC2E60|nr:hypothetical protein [Streptomyces sp. Vc74B-19]MBT3161509.1 hypothetical protein [Streptomyces sp. Vc74B-19]